MIEHIGRVNMDYMVRLAGAPDWAKREMGLIEAYNDKHGATFDGKPIPVPIKPHFISPKQRKIMERAVSRIWSALDKFIDHWLENEELQALWGVTPDELALYKVDPGYPGAIQVARFDGFLRNYELQFLEFNCDSPGGPGYSDVIQEAFVHLYERNDGLDDNYHVRHRSRVDQLRDALLSCYRRWRTNGHQDHPHLPYIVVTDWTDVGSRPDIDILVDRLGAQGLDIHFADPRDLELRDDGLYHDNDRVDLVYKRVIVKELVAEPKAQALAEAYKRGLVCMANSPRSVIVGNKKILAALRRPDVQAILAPDERQAVKDHVPWTEVLREAKVEFRGFTVNLRDFVIDNKDQLVLKAAQSYGGKDVFIGFETDEADWFQLVEDHIDDNSWVVQQLVPIPKELFPRFVEDEMRTELLNVNINPFVFGGSYAGAYTRISKQNVINVSFGGGIAPTITAVPTEGDGP